MEKRTSASKKFLKWRIRPISNQAWHSLGSFFQVMSRTLGTDMQQHGTTKDARRIFRHASIKTNGKVYMQGNIGQCHDGDQFTDARNSDKAVGHRHKIGRCNLSQSEESVATSTGKEWLLR